MIDHHARYEHSGRIAMMTETNAVTFRQNLGDMLNRAQYRHDSVVISEAGKPQEPEGLAEIDDLVDALSIQPEMIEPAEHS